MFEVGPFHFSTFQVGPGSWKFCDRNVDDVKDGYVSCQPFQDTRKWGLVRKMLRTKMSYKLANRLRKRRSSYYLLGQVILNRNSKALKAATVLASFLLAAPPKKVAPSTATPTVTYLSFRATLEKVHMLHCHFVMMAVICIGTSVNTRLGPASSFNKVTGW